MKGSQRGFQLLELMLVCFLIAVGAALGASAWYEWVGQHRLHSAAEGLSTFLQGVRLSAVSRNAAIQVRVQGNRYAMALRGSDAVVWQRFPQGVQAVRFPRRPVTFFSRGNAAPAGSFVLQNRSGQIRVVVSPTGRVRKEDWFPTSGSQFAERRRVR